MEQHPKVIAAIVSVAVIITITIISETSFMNSLGWMLGLLQEYVWRVYTTKGSGAAGRHGQADLGGPGLNPSHLTALGLSSTDPQPGLQASQNQAESGEVAAARTRPLQLSDGSWEPWSFKVAIGTFRGGSEIFPVKEQQEGGGTLAAGGGA